VKRECWARESALLAGVFGAAACSPVAAKKLHKQQSYVFGTLVEITVYGEAEDKARRVTDQVLKDFDAMHQTLHAWQPGDAGTAQRALAKAAGTPRRALLTPELAPMLRDAAAPVGAVGRVCSIRPSAIWCACGAFIPTLSNRACRMPKRSNAGRGQPGMADLHIDGDLLIASNPAARSIWAVMPRAMRWIGRRPT
jgi:FAD:protein FMN transferase